MNHDRTSGVRVPPYLLTGGRTSPSVALALESRVQRLTTNAQSAGGPRANLPELEAILAACRLPTPLVEIAGRTRLPLQVARILIGDLVDAGLVAVEPTSTASERPDIQLLERVLNGLRESG